MPDLVGHYLEPLARDIHVMTGSDSRSSNTKVAPQQPVWASPYYVFNMTRHNASTIMTPRFYADWWGQVFVEAPHLDFIAPQDSMGACFVCWFECCAGVSTCVCFDGSTSGVDQGCLLLLVTMQEHRETLLTT